MNFKAANRTFTIFTIFAVAAIGATIWFYFARYKADDFVTEYLERITICSSIKDEQQCYDKEFCEGVYSPSCPECNDLTFQHCQRISLTTEASLKKEQKLCEDTSGKWYTNKYGRFCLCNTVSGEKFDKDKGCIEI